MAQVDNDKEKSTLTQNELPQVMQDSNSKSGGVYIPPYRMASMIEAIRNKNDKSSDEYQRLMWDLLKKSINGIINKVNISNIQNIIYELFNENLIRGKGLLVRSIIKAQNASPNFTHIYAALISVINTKLPDIGKLLLSRTVLSFRRAYRKSNKISCIATTKMIAHLINQGVSDELLGFEILDLLLENLSPDSIELACMFLLECGMCLSEANPSMTNLFFEKFRNILQEGKIDKRVQYIIENLFLERKRGFKDHPMVIPELDLVLDDDKVINLVGLDDNINGEDELDIYHYDENYEENENLWNNFKAEILGEEENNNLNEVNDQQITELVENGEGENQKEEESEEESEKDNNNKIIDLNEEDSIKFRKVIYLTIISSIDHLECCHKLLKLNMKEGQEIELVNMIIECCIQERAYLRFYGLLSERLCLLKEAFKKNFEMQFENQYIKVHRFETNKLRNLAKMFAHLLYTNAIDWNVLSIIKLTEEDTTASSRIFCKIVFQELAEYMGLEKLNDKLQEHATDEFSGLFCRDNPKNTRFCINFFTSIGLGGLTQELREFLKNAEKMVLEREESEEESESGSVSRSVSDSDNEESESKSRSKSESSNSSGKSSKSNWSSESSGGMKNSSESSSFYSQSEKSGKEKKEKPKDSGEKNKERKDTKEISNGSSKDKISEKKRKSSRERSDKKNRERKREKVKYKERSRSRSKGKSKSKSKSHKEKSRRKDHHRK